jgi:Zn-dependent protease with chaperone function
MTVQANALLKAPPVRVPTGTSIRFAILVITAVVATGSIFGYFWQVARPNQEAKAQTCISPSAVGSLGQAVKGLSQRAAANGFLVAACLRTDAPSLAAWFLIGVALLVILTALLYRLTPWWMITVGRPGWWHGLAVLDPADRKRVSDVARRVTLQDQPEYFLDRDPGLLRSRGARAFGHGKRTFIQLDSGLVAASSTEPEDFEKVLLHELAHLQNGDIPSTYLTIALRRAFAVLIPAGYLAALLIARTTPSVPDPRTLVAVPALAAVVELGARSVLRAREYHADATADSSPAPGVPEDRPGNRPDGARSGNRQDRALAAAREGLSRHPTTKNRTRALRNPETQYRPDVLAMFTAGIAIGILISELNTEMFAATLPMIFGPDSPLVSGLHALAYIFLTFGPAALLAAILIAWLARDVTARLHYRFLVTGDRVPFVLLAAAMAVGMVLGEPLSFSNSLAGTWGYLDTSALRDLGVAGLSAGLLVVVLATVFRWASENAAVWFDGGKPARAMAVLVGAAGLAPVLWAWNINHETSLNLQILWGPDRAQRPLIGDWPGVGALFAHFEPLGAFDIVPGNALLLALPFLFVAAGRLRPARSTRPEWLPANAEVPVKVTLAAGLTGAAVSLVLVLDLMLSLHTVLGTSVVTRAGGYGLLYLTRSAETMTALCAGAAAAWAASRARGTRLTTAILTALIAVTGTAVFTPYLLYAGFLGWPHRAVNPVNDRVLYGIVGTLSPGRAVVCALVLMMIGGLLSHVLSRVRPARRLTRIWIGGVQVRGGTTVARVADVSVLILMIGLLAMAAYDFLRFGLSYVLSAAVSQVGDVVFIPRRRTASAPSAPDRAGSHRPGAAPYPARPASSHVYLDDESRVTHPLDQPPEPDGPRATREHAASAARSTRRSPWTPRDPRLRVAAADAQPSPR